MRIINIEAIGEFDKIYPRARKPLRRWTDITYAADWANFAEVKMSFNTADYVQGYVVFDIAGNLYRLISTIRYQDRIVIVESVFTHEEYDRWQP